MTSVECSVYLLEQRKINWFTDHEIKDIGKVHDLAKFTNKPGPKILAWSDLDRIFPVETN